MDRAWVEPEPQSNQDPTPARPWPDLCSFVSIRGPPSSPANNDTMDLLDTHVYGLIGDEGFARLVAAFYRRVPADVVRTRFPSQVKIGPVERIGDLVNLQLPGIPLNPLPVAPRQIPFHAGS